MADAGISYRHIGASGFSQLLHTYQPMMVMMPYPWFFPQSPSMVFHQFRPCYADAGAQSMVAALSTLPLEFPIVSNYARFPSEGWKYSRNDLLHLRASHCLRASICDRVKQLGLWRRRRGTRAGCRHSWHPASDRIVGRPIPTFIGQRSFREVKVSARNNAERIRCLRSIDVADFRMPVFFVSNVCHLLNKIDDIDVCLRQFRPNIVCFTETWLNSNIPDSIISFPGYSVVRRDRCSGEGGGVAIYVTDNIQYTRLKQIDSKEFEVFGV
jgi:hypothetical protein